MKIGDIVIVNSKPYVFVNLKGIIKLIHPKEHIRIYPYLVKVETSYESSPLHLSIGEIEPVNCSIGKTWERYSLISRPTGKEIYWDSYNIEAF